jgi:ATP-dependent DNA helicase RecG
MNEKYIRYILKKGEGQTVEFKKAVSELPSNIFETVCAFLNRNGGTILLGVDDQANIIGVDPDKIDKITKDLVSLSNNASKLSPAFLLQPML